MERIHHRHRVGEFFGGGGLEPGEPVHRHDLDRVAPRLVAGSASQVLNACFDRPSTMSSSRAGPVPSRMPVRSMITVTNLSPRRVCRQQCSSTPIAVTPSNRCGSSISSRWPFGQHGVVGGVPRHGESFGDAGDGQVLDHQTLQRPPQPATGQLGSRLGGPAGVLPPHVSAAVAAVAADRHQQDGRSPPERLVRQLADDRVARDTLAAAAVAPVVRSTTRHASTARSGSRRCPVTTSPSSSSRQNMVRSGQPKPASG